MEPSDTTVRTGQEPEGEAPDEGYPALRKGGGCLLVGLLLFCLVYYPFFSLAVRTVIPFAALVLLGFATGLVFPRSLFRACSVLWWLVVLAVVLRRAVLAHLPVATQVFDGALLGYPPWAVWFAEVLRVGSYFWALWIGGRLGARLRGRR